MKQLLLFLFCIVGLGFFPFDVPAFAQGQDVILSADRLVYDEAGYRATAEGHVDVRHGDMRLMAPYVEVDTESQLLEAHARPGEQVSIAWQGRLMKGESLAYNLQTWEGYFRNASGSVDALRLWGEDLKVAPSEKAVEKKWLNKRQARGSSEEEEVALWENVTVTTCKEAHPHYRLVSTRLVVVPGKRVVVKNPKVYLGEYALFTYPFDYVVNIAGKRPGLSANFLPSLTYDGTRGAGIGLDGPFSWETGELRLGAMWWSSAGVEGWAKLEQEVATGLTLFAATEYTFDAESDDKSWRPSWGLTYARNGWDMSLRWSQREYVEIEKQAGVTYKGILWRDPEFNLRGPWWRDPASGGWWRLHATYGEYEEEGLRTERKGLGLEIYGQGTPSDFRPFWHATYWQYQYDRDDGEQDITEAAVGFDWKISRVGLRSTYARRWVTGESPMLWDRLEEREDLYQKVSVPLGAGWGFAVRGAYDLLESELREMVYWVSLEQDCLSWQLVVRDDQHGTDDWAGLRIIVNAYPDSPLWVGQKEAAEPGARPEDLPEEGE